MFGTSRRDLGAPALPQLLAGVLNLAPISVLTTTAGAPSLGLPFLNTNNLVGLQFVGGHCALETCEAS